MSHTRASSLGWKDGSMSSEDATPAPSEEDGVGKDPFGDHVREGSPLVEQLHFRHDSKPVSRRLDPLRGAQRTQEVSSSVKTSRILVVEDNVVNRKVLCSMLKQLGFINVVVAVNGAVAMDLVTGPGAQAFDLCIMDCLMPIMDGWEATREIRKWELSQMKASVSETDEENPPRRLTIIALTAHVTMRDRDECLESGMDDFMVKPVSIEQVTSALIQWLPNAFEPLPHGVDISEIKRWPHSIVNNESMKKHQPRRFSQSQHSVASSVSATSTPLEEVGALLLASLSSQDGDYEERIPSSVIKNLSQKKSEFSPLLIESSVLGRQKTKSITSETGSVNVASIYNGEMMNSAQSLMHLHERSPVLEQADLPGSIIYDLHLSRALQNATMPKKVLKSSPLIEASDRTITAPVDTTSIFPPVPPINRSLARIVQSEGQKAKGARTLAALKSAAVESNTSENTQSCTK